jgi:hypothetical protein
MSTYFQKSSADLAHFIAAMEILADHGFKSSPRSWEVFQNLPAERRQAVLDKIQQDIAFHDEATRAGIGKHQSSELLRYFLKKMNWNLSEKVFSHLSEEDVIEVYSPNFTQLFRNLKFLEICSYPILDIYLYEWPELYTRPQAITEALIQECVRALGAASDQDFFGDSVPDHFLEEVFSEERRVFKIEQKFISPVRCATTGVVVGMLGCLAASVHSKRGERRTVLPLGHPVSGSGKSDR